MPGTPTTSMIQALAQGSLPLRHETSGRRSSAVFAVLAGAGLLLFLSTSAYPPTSTVFIVGAREIRLLPLSLDNERIHASDVTRLAFSAIKSVTIGARHDQRAVLLAGDFETEIIGHGLRLAVQEWLKNYLLSRIATRQQG